MDVGSVSRTESPPDLVHVPPNTFPYATAVIISLNLGKGLPRITTSISMGVGPFLSCYQDRTSDCPRGCGIGNKVDCMVLSMACR